ncbi:helix-turn-helix transcriptional regulator [Mailhella sp.]|uniref:helix-turn-helix transcriptional regulator n=1 Tax=Mailhella sp. TaxID=1981029 RepID=UPI004063E592
MKLNLPEVGYLRLSQILNIIPISKSAWWEECRSGLYPKPVKLGPRTTAWRVEDIRDLMERINKESLYE